MKKIKDFRIRINKSLFDFNHGKRTDLRNSRGKFTYRFNVYEYFKSMRMSNHFVDLSVDASNLKKAKIKAKKEIIQFQKYKAINL